MTPSLHFYQQGVFSVDTVLHLQGSSGQEYQSDKFCLSFRKKHSHLNELWSDFR